MTSAMQSVFGAATLVAAFSVAPRLIRAQQPIEPQTIVRSWKTVNRCAIVIESDTAFDAVYLRPFNFRASDSTRHAHAIQYISQPAHPWDRLRSQRSGQYEKPVLPEPDPNAWVHLKVVVRGNDVSAFVNGTGSPALHVQGLSGRSRGGSACGSAIRRRGDFANLVVRPGK